MMGQTESGTQRGGILFTLKKEGNLIIYKMFEARGLNTKITQAQKDRQKDSSHLHAESKTGKLRQSYSGYNRQRGRGWLGLIKVYQASIPYRKANSRSLLYSMAPTVNKTLHC